MGDRKQFSFRDTPLSQQQNVLVMAQSVWVFALPNSKSRDYRWMYLTRLGSRRTTAGPFRTRRHALADAEKRIIRYRRRRLDRILKGKA